MSVAYIVEALFEETLRELDQRAEHELWRIGSELSYWLRHMLMRMPCDTWRYEFDRQIAKMAREHVIVAEESCRAWIDRLRACNEAAEEDARAMGSAEAVRARMREYFKWPDPPQYPNDKPAPFDPDYPQLRRSGNSIMERSPPAEWVDQAEFALQSYRVPQEINLGTIQRFRQDFEAHVVCLKGIEKGATYGGVRWWVEYVVRPGRPGGNASTDYTFSSDAQIINGPPSREWCNQASRYFPDGG